MYVNTCILGKTYFIEEQYMYVYSGRGGVALNWNKQVFQNKLHTSADKNTFWI